MSSAWLHREAHREQKMEVGLNKHLPVIPRGDLWPVVNGFFCFVLCYVSLYIGCNTAISPRVTLCLFDTQAIRNYRTLLYNSTLMTEQIGVLFYACVTGKVIEKWSFYKVHLYKTTVDKSLNILLMTQIRDIIWFRGFGQNHLRERGQS